MLKRIKNFWRLSRKDPKALAILENLNEEQLKLVPDEGDGKAEFFGEPTPEEELDFEREKNGDKPWYDRLKDL